jgi:hypothetical protein
MREGVTFISVEEVQRQHLRSEGVHRGSNVSRNEEIAGFGLGSAFLAKY